MEKKPVYNESDLKDHLGIWLWLENENGEIFMFYHKKFGCWTIPLEKSDPGETLNEAVLRTGNEELGINITNFAIVHTQENNYIRDGNKVKVEASLVKVLCYDNEIRNMEPDKHLDADWKNKEFILKLEDSTDAVKALQEYIK